MLTWIHEGMLCRLILLHSASAGYQWEAAYRSHRGYWQSVGTYDNIDNARQAAEQAAQEEVER